MVQNEIFQREYMKYDKNVKDRNVENNIFLWLVKEVQIMKVGVLNLENDFQNECILF